jgi:hypothetical protein
VFAQQTPSRARPSAPKAPARSTGGDLAESDLSNSAQIPTQRGPEVTDTFDPANRVAGVAKGAQGALIGRGSEVVLRGGRTARSKEAARVPDGAPCTVTAVADGMIEVSVRVGEKMVRGWTEAATFARNPDLPKDEENKSLTEDRTYQHFGGDHSPVDPKGEDTAQGGLGDCFFIASMAAVANANPKAIEEAIQYDPKSGKYKVRFFEEGRSGMKPVWIEVDAYLPVEAGGAKNDPVYAGDPGGKLWPAIMEKAYAQWKGGYDVLNEGGTGDEALAEITGSRSRSKDPARMKESEVIPYFKSAQEAGLAVYAGVRDKMAGETQTPLRGSGSGPYSGTISQFSDWNEVTPGTLSIVDTGGSVKEVRDSGKEGDDSAALRGADLTKGQIDYKANSVELAYKSGKAPAEADDLEVRYAYHGMLDKAKVIIGNHAYAFQGVVEGDKLQFYNPWGVGSYQPKPITAAEFLRYFDSLTTNAAGLGNKTGP